ncbi:hypothetical protein MTO96_032302, partial [Rhipicephalus appendiculatus]
LPLHPTLQLLRPRPGEPGSPENPGTIQPGTTQLRRKNQLCNEKTICEEGEREAEVFGESKDEGASGQTEEALVVEPAENESAADLLVVPTVECGLTLCDYEETHPPSSPSVAFVSGATPDCVGVKPSDQDDCNQDSAPRERKRL